MNRLPLQLVVLCLAASHSWTTQGAESAYPTKPVRVVVPFPAGSTTDIVSRLITQKLSSLWGQPVIIDNRVGAGGTIGAMTVARATPDGYTMLVGGTATHAIAPNLRRHLDYNAIKDFSPVSLLATTPYLLVINPQVPANSVKELIALAAAKPGVLNYASGGNGSAPHLTAAIFTSMAGIDIRHVPYKGSTPAITDLIGGRVQVIFTGIPSVLAHLRSSRLKALAITSKERTSVLPKLPTVAEAGLAGYDVSPWFGVLAPARAPAPVLRKISSDISSILADPDLKERLRGDGVELKSASPEYFGAFIGAELGKWGRAVKESGMRVD